MIEQDAHNKIRLGTAGFSFADWRRVFYPEKLPREKWLKYYADVFDMVEINTTFYRPQNAQFFKRLLKKAPQLDYVVKANQKITHERTAEKEDFRFFRESLLPLEENGRLGGILLQFPFSFKYTAKNFETLRKITEQLAPLPRMVEFRHSSWPKEVVINWLDNSNISFVNTDNPNLNGLLPRLELVTAKKAYIRFHGRNSQDWYHKGSDSSARYRYGYSDQELEGWKEAVSKMLSEASSIYLVFNNHPDGNAVTNALKMAQILGIDKKLPGKQMELF